MTREFETEWRPRALSVLRIAAGLTFLCYGTEKILGFPAGRTPEMFTMSWTAGVIELVTGALIALGLLTRPAAFIASGTMAAAYFIAHAPQSVFPSVNGGAGAILFCFVFFYLIFAGPGPWSIDALRARRAGA
ncbi:putative oxidoreductase [Roseovarius nanhaiticus]|uniref:Putative oxidoreductase n=1 Tax=Roseovarius nanhaiticus TaxID=573024 RepID=A0A1N7FSG0_9RHOB|nr:DoxX family protein [Roseovarius nanhaiticus]SEK46666.1 putative oxidoreductase [Roseovarius nanhaiticus]SIS03273.1 putative oxidoreductase [Roseovarius nanhaiticus]